MNIGKENEYVEHKKSTSELNAGLISISSILNKHGKGTVYFGVKNNGDICGQEIGQDTLRDISSKISTAIKPTCTFEVNERNTSEGETFIEVTFITYEGSSSFLHAKKELMRGIYPTIIEEDKLWALN